MNVRTKLLLGYGFCFFLLLITATSAFCGFSSLGRGIDHVLRENYRSVTASAEIMEILERQDSLLLSHLLSPGTSTKELVTLENRFQTAMKKVRANITIKNEEPIIQKVQETYSRFKKARTFILKSEERTPARALEIYKIKTYPVFETVKDAVRDLIRVNQQAMFEADQESRRAVSLNAVWLGIIIIVAMITVAVIYRWLHQDVLARLIEIKHVAEEAGHRRITVLGKDELAAIGKSINGMLDAEQASKAKAKGDLRFNERLLVAITRMYRDDYLIVGLDGRMLLSGLGAERARQVSEVSSRIQFSKQGLIAAATSNDGSTEVELAGHRIARLRLLTAAPEKPIAWMVEMDE